MTEASIDVKTLAEALRIAMNPSKAEQAKFQEREPGRPHDRIKCVSPTGSTFTAVVGVSKAFPDHGRVVKLEDYEYPPDHVLFPASADGSRKHLATDERGNSIPGQLTPESNSYRYQTTYRADLRAYVGQPFDRTLDVANAAKVAEMRAALDAEAAKRTAAIVAPKTK